MEIKFFSDLIDALQKLIGGPIAMTESERKKYHQVFEEAYRLIDSTLNIIIVRLGDILLIENENSFFEEVNKLDNNGEWWEAERKFRLCKSLRASLREIQTLQSELKGKISIQDWEAVIRFMEDVLRTEGEVAEYIGKRFKELSDSIRDPGMDEKTLRSAVRQQVERFREKLIMERQRLIQQEVELYKVV